MPKREPSLLLEATSKDDRKKLRARRGNILTEPIRNWDESTPGRKERAASGDHNGRQKNRLRSGARGTPMGLWDCKESLSTKPRTRKEDCEKDLH